MQSVNFTINITPRTKKNSSQLIYNRKTHKWQPIASKAYRAYEAAAGKYLNDIVKLQAMALRPPFNVRAVFYMDSRRLVDLVNLEQALCDILVHYKIIEDDNSRIIASMDGSRVRYDKANPRTEVTIEEVQQ